MADDTLKKLHPLDRIKKLKEQEEKSKKELEEAAKKLKDLELAKKKETADTEKLIRESEVEIQEEGKKREKIPIAEVASESGSGLSAEAKQIIKQMKGGAAAKATTSDTEKVSKTYKKSLEEEVAGEAVVPERLVRNAQYGNVNRRRESAIPDYEAARSFSEKPMEELYKQALSLYHDVKSSGGYMTAEQQEQLRTIAGGVDLKVRDAREGTYSSWSEELAEKASIVKSIAARTSLAYRPQRLIHEERDWYKGMGD